MVVLRGKVVGPMGMMALGRVSPAAMSRDSVSNSAEPSLGGLIGVVGNPSQEDLASLGGSALRGVTGFYNLLFWRV